MQLLNLVGRSPPGRLREPLNASVLITYKGRARAVEEASLENQQWGHPFVGSNRTSPSRFSYSYLSVRNSSWLANEIHETPCLSARVLYSASSSDRRLMSARSLQAT
jgi:hypothetical protein